jgi:hypothetical protein
LYFDVSVEVTGHSNRGVPIRRPPDGGQEGE